MRLEEIPSKSLNIQIYTQEIKMSILIQFFVVARNPSIRPSKNKRQKRSKSGKISIFLAAV
jgi:hypothetical protein